MVVVVVVVVVMEGGGGGWWILVINVVADVRISRLPRWILSRYL